MRIFVLTFGLLLSVSAAALDVTTLKAGDSIQIMRDTLVQELPTGRGNANQQLNPTGLPSVVLAAGTVATVVETPQRILLPPDTGLTPSAFGGGRALMPLGDLFTVGYNLVLNVGNTQFLLTQRTVYPWDPRASGAEAEAQMNQGWQTVRDFASLQIDDNSLALNKAP